MARIKYVSEQGLLFENRVSSHRSCPVEHDGMTYHRSIWDMRAYSDFPPHNEGLNVGLADGHAKWYKIDEMSKTNSRLFWY